MKKTPKAANHIPQETERRLIAVLVVDALFYKLFKHQVLGPICGWLDEYAAYILYSRYPFLLHVPSSTLGNFFFSVWIFSIN